jgi:hypothetical protein
MKKIIITFVCAIFVVAGSVFLQSCESEYSFNKKTEIDEAIVNSPELEEFVLAGLEFEKSLANLTHKLNSIDFSTLEVTYDADGRKIRRVPIGLVFSEIENNAQKLNETRDALLDKYPEFTSFREDVGTAHISRAIHRSPNAKSRYLALRGASSQPRLKSGNEQNGTGHHFMDNCYLESFLYGWATTNNPAYRELWIIGYEDGTWATLLYPNATSGTVGKWLPFMTPDRYSGGTWDGHSQWHYPEGGSDSRIVKVGHTHVLSPNHTPGFDDFDVPNGVERFIYFNGELRQY